MVEPGDDGVSVTTRPPADPIPTRPLDGGLILRPGTLADIEQIVALSVEAHGERERWGVRWLLESEHAGPDSWGVVADGDRIVAASVGLLPTYVLGGIPIPVGQVEYVATLPDYRNRGLVRAIFTALERRAEEAGALLHIVEGIPYFYRVLGYGYGLSYPPMMRIDRNRVEAPSDAYHVRPAHPDDLPAIRALHEAAQSRASLIRPWPDHEWDALLEGAAASGEQVLVAADSTGEVAVWTRRVHYDDFGYLLAAATATNADAAKALIAGALQDAGDETVQAYVRAHDPWGAVVRDVGTPLRWFSARYAKVPDPVRLLDHIRPVLSARVASSSFSGEVGELTMSLYHSSVVLSYAQGEVTAVRWAPGLQDPQEDGAPGIPPDWLPAFAFGRMTAAELEERHDDILLDDFRPLIDALFPAVSSDLSWLL